MQGLNSAYDQLLGRWNFAAIFQVMYRRVGGVKSFRGLGFRGLGL